MYFFLRSLNVKGSYAGIWKRWSSSLGSDFVAYPSTETTKLPLSDGSPRQQKRMVYCIVSYRGTGYAGLQYNDAAKTIQGEIFRAFCNVGAISPFNADNPRKVRVRSAARTDKGVHAIVNVLGLKLLDHAGSFQPWVSLVNEQLPESIRVWKIERTLNSFSPHKACHSRLYEYWVPAFALATPSPSSLDSLLFTKHFQLPHTSHRSILETIQKIHSEENSGSSPFRISSSKLECLKEACSLFQGTHSFHNYTTEKKFGDPSARRYMLHVGIDAIHFDKYNRQWLKLTFHGQSFMKHQIRKMISVLIYLVRSYPFSNASHVIPATFQNHIRLHIPKAPPETLLLAEPIFRSFQNRCEKFDYEPLEWSSFEDNMAHFANHYLRTPMLENFVFTDAYTKFFMLQKQDRLLHEFTSAMQTPSNESYQ
ncbi:tRNA pseudouridine synthase [Schizosaccharomyces cryophilus OY26]|uniref:tRNA pseudouridine synthase n=1 Tax=Schizosaccharomyces cryophilus (strain OY26 / ATCC MYA-4695 / CBS 11777 / NBRC 106824 / NRRL Y48691) TaxID=653667 RepID=S9VUZ5_SCHCR|nr:tRNA pseudouridine synthase [Schizosaccharomyces cryophilus OY26]EPY49875.1 tRNA pseudouridine synthase [Schizosaccharomyces cryophilus OY26]